METYLPHIFYDTSKITKSQFRKLMIEAQTLSFDWWVDRKPASSFSREKIDWPFKRAIKVFDRTTRKDLHITVIHRRWMGEKDHHIEIGFCTLARKGKDGDIFLWIKVKLEHKDLLNKYNLVERI